VVELGSSPFLVKDRLVGNIDGMIDKLYVELFVFIYQFKLPPHEFTSCPIFFFVDNQIRGIS